MSNEIHVGKMRASSQDVSILDGLFWRQILEGLPLGIAILARNSGETLWANRSFSALLASEGGVGKVLGLGPTQYLPGLDATVWEESLRLALHNLPPGSPTPGRRLQLVDQATRNIAYWEWTLQRMESEAADHGSYVLLTLSSISETVMNERLLATMSRTALSAQREAEEARRSAVDALAELQATQRQMVQMEKMRAVGELASGVAHDFNNALMAILGYTELAEDDIDEPQTLASHLAIIKKAALDASSTVERLQSFARQRVANRGKLTDINAVVADVVELTRPRWRDAAQKEGRTYEVQTVLGPVPPIPCEPGGLREVLINMIHNALNAMPQGGKLTIGTRRLDTDRVGIEVTDTGMGMPPDVVSRIFDPFFTTRGVEGTGMGLAVSWTIIQRHGGSIDVESEPGRGTRFLVRLPIGGQADADVETVSVAPRPMQLPKANVLVVDDEPNVAGVLSNILSRHGFRVTAVNSAGEALARLSEETFHLVLTDHGMPGMTGLQLVAETKRLHPQLPVLLLTGWGESVLQTHVAETPPDAVLSKPINQIDLLNALQRVLTEQVGPHIQ
jgi:signal transduction histidine kinase/ActR/RegA family two-component response regulator